MLTFACTAQVWYARRTSVSQVARAAAASRVPSRLLVPVPTGVPSGTKLSVRCGAFGHGIPNWVGFDRSSSWSRESRCRVFMVSVMGGRCVRVVRFFACFLAGLKVVRREVDHGDEGPRPGRG